MPLFDPDTNSKACSKCEKVFVGDDVPKNFFKLQSTKDGYARPCKACYYIKATPDQAQARNDAIIERKYTKMIEAEPIKDRPASKKAFTHSDKEIKEIERSSGLKFIEWMDMGDSWVPRFGKAEK